MTIHRQHMATPRDPQDLSILFELFVATQRVRQLLSAVAGEDPASAGVVHDPVCQN